MSRVYIYVVDRDFGFAPNPFHGVLTLATCKPEIRRMANVGDWIFGVGGRRLNATGRCVFAARVTDHRTFDEYWSDPAFFDKRPVRNGSSRMMVGDNIYHRNATTKKWRQEDSHHSYADGSANPVNVSVDTRTNRVLISTHFFYFGREAPVIPTRLLTAIGYSNGRNYRVFSLSTCAKLIAWLESRHTASLNQVMADPLDFESSDMRYSAANNRVSRD